MAGRFAVLEVRATARYCIPLMNGFSAPLGSLWLKRAYKTTTATMAAAMPSSLDMAAPALASVGHDSHSPLSVHRV